MLRLVACASDVLNILSKRCFEHVGTSILSSGAQGFSPNAVHYFFHHPSQYKTTPFYESLTIAANSKSTLNFGGAGLHMFRTMRNIFYFYGCIGRCTGTI